MKKKHPKMDKKLVAAKQSFESEVKYIASHYKIPIKKVREAMWNAGKGGKPARSREEVYAKLKEMGLMIKKPVPQPRAPKMVALSQVRLEQGIPL